MGPRYDLDKYKKVVVSTLHQDKDEFMLYRDERLPIALHLLVIFVSLPLLGMIGMINYQNAATGNIFGFRSVVHSFSFLDRHKTSRRSLAERVDRRADNG